MSDPEPFPLRDGGEPLPNSSRSDARWAGWSRSRERYDLSGDGEWTWANDPGRHGAWEALLDERIDARWRSFSWLTARALLDSANDKIAKLINDLVGPRRQRWVAAQRAAGVEERFGPDLIVREERARSFLVVGDPGEADGSQYAVIDPMLNVHRDRRTDFMVVLSDVIYPAGDVNDYVNGFYIPFRDYEEPIYALPGNHDWYDGLNGFMRVFCGAEPLPPTEYRRSSFTAPERLARLLWRQASRPNRTRLLRHRRQHPASAAGSWQPPQPGPYYVIDMVGVRLVGIDTGIGGTIDAEQAEWLIRVSRDKPDLPKVLLTGKPIWVDGEYKPTPIEWEPGATGPYEYDTVDDIVLDPVNRYVAAIGGDTHNYQRYTVTTVEEGPAGKDNRRRLEYVVSGGAGAYTSATHRIPDVNHADRSGPVERVRRRAEIGRDGNAKHVEFEPPPKVLRLTEKQARFYPMRGDSLAYYTRWFGPRLTGTAALLCAATILSLIGLGVWEGLADVGNQRVWEVFVAAIVATPLAVLFVIGSIWLARSIAPRGYRTVSIALFVPAAAAVASLLLSNWGAWEWIWKVLLLTLAAIALPLVIALAGYYGLGSNMAGHFGRMPRQLALALLIVAEVLMVLFLGFDLDPGDAVLVIAVSALATLALLVLMSRTWDPAGERLVRRRALVTILAALVTYGVLVGAPIASLWDDWWAIQVMLIGGCAVVVALTVGLLGWVLLEGGWTALRKLYLLKGRVNPNEAVAYINSRYGDAEAGTARATEQPGDAANAIGKMLLPPVKDPPRGRKRKKRSKSINAFISEAGNADTPPMFKSFLRVEVTDRAPDGRRLEISCYGVTGWRALDGSDAERPVPVEDFVSIPLG